MMKPKAKCPGLSPFTPYFIYQTFTVLFLPLCPAARHSKFLHQAFVYHFLKTFFMTPILRDIQQLKPQNSVQIYGNEHTHN